VRRPEATQADRDVARGALEGVVQKLVGDAAPSQLARAFLGLAELELGRGDLEAGRKALASAVAKRREGDASLSEELARASARAFDLDLAEKEAKRALAGLGSTRVAPRIVLGDVALKRGRPAQALQQLDDVGRRPDGLLLRARANLALGKNEAARVDAEEALRVAPDLISAKVLLARLDYVEGHPDRALRELDRLDRTTRSAEAAYALGEALAPRLPERARFWLTQALARDPLLLEARLRLARLLRDQNRLDEARTELIQTTSQNPAYVPALRDLAALALDQGDAVTARDQFEQLVSGEPDVSTWVGAARAHLALGDPAGALERVRKAQEQKPTGALAEETADTAARAHLALRQPGEAVTLLKPFVPLATRAETGGLLMLAHLDLGQPERAAGVILVLPPRLRGSPEVLTARARLLVDRARDSVAEGFATAALAKLQKPTAPRWVKAEAQAVLGRAQWNQGSMKLALKSLKAATELDPAHRTAFYYLGLVYEELGKFVEGRDALEQAVKNDPKFEEAWYYLGELRRKAGDDDYADAYKQYLDMTSQKGLFADDARRWLGDAATRSSSGPRRKRLGR
jgi:tetratricopeptide (TPR) repeat protein